MKALLITSLFLLCFSFSPSELIGDGGRFTVRDGDEWSGGSNGKAIMGGIMILVCICLVIKHLISPSKTPEEAADKKGGCLVIIIFIAAFSAIFIIRSFVEEVDLKLGLLFGGILAIAWWFIGKLDPKK